MQGSSELYDALNISSITTLLDTYASYPALFDDDLLPQDFTDHNSINYYLITSAGGSVPYGQYNYSASCRGISKSDSRTLAQAVKDGINRKSYGDYYIVASIQQSLPPQDDTDNYNTPVEITLKTR